VFDAGSKIPDPQNLIPDMDPRVKKAPDPGSGSATLPVRYILSLICLKKWFKNNLIAQIIFIKGRRWILGSGHSWKYHLYEKK
jgi:hypothetical protein